MTEENDARPLDWWMEGFLWIELVMMYVIVTHGIYTITHLQNYRFLVSTYQNNIKLYVKKKCVLGGNGTR